MGLKITSLDELTTDQVQQAHAEIAELLQEQYPEVELSMGVIYSLICYFSGVFGAREQVEVQRVMDSNSLLQITTDPAMADPELVDKVLSNYRITRKAGTGATGMITIVIDRDVTTIIPVGAIYAANGLSFAVDAAYTARATNTTAYGDTEVGLQPLGDGRYSFSVPATCTTTGPTGNLRRGTRMTPVSPPAGYVTSYAANDFSNGLAEETNAEILARMELGIAAKAWSNVKNIVAMIKEQALFENTIDYSIVGMGYPEQWRDQHGIIPLSGGGKTDIYARTSRTPMHSTLTKTATFVGTVAEGGVWQFTLTKDDAPGFYEVRQVLLPTDDPESIGFQVVADVRGLDLAGDNLLPDVVDAVEGAYSRFQTAVIRFVDTQTPVVSLTAGTSTADYTVVVSHMPLIAELQNFLTGSEVRDPAGDCLVKAPVPCFLAINFDIQQATSETTPDTDAIRVALADAVNSLGFPGQLHASYIADVVHRYLTTKQAVSRFDLHGRILRPDGETTYIRDAEVIQIPDDPLNLVTGRTTAFLLDPNDIGITVRTEGFTKRV